VQCKRTAKISEYSENYCKFVIIAAVQKEITAKRYYRQLDRETENEFMDVHSNV